VRPNTALNYKNAVRAPHEVGEKENSLDIPLARF
jgi:hypothetical protein